MSSSLNITGKVSSSAEAQEVTHRINHHTQIENMCMVAYAWGGCAQDPGSLDVSSALVHAAYRSTPWEAEQAEASSSRTAARIMFVSESGICRSFLAQVGDVSCTGQGVVILFVTALACIRLTIGIVLLHTKQLCT